MIHILLHNTILKVEDDSLFSEDETESFEIGSQVEKITKFLGHDRLRFSHRLNKQ